MQNSFLSAADHLQECEPGPRTLPCAPFREPGRPESQSGKRPLDVSAAPAGREVAAHNKIDESIAYMTQHLNRPLQVAFLAAMVSISPSHYFALFKRRTGHAPMDYFTQLRMEEARRLLQTTSSFVKEVAAALGYEDPFYFSRVFKSVQGVAPSEYRTRQSRTNGENL